LIDLPIEVTTEEKATYFAWMFESVYDDHSKVIGRIDISWDGVELNLETFNFADEEKNLIYSGLRTILYWIYWTSPGI
jgi:hypothetical protein